ncbi:MAG: hypothetical protein JJU45_00375 [Acidimicrobiia bacterium]|nr:hypothetical protein [Acidimicrobiia bacterium]
MGERSTDAVVVAFVPDLMDRSKVAAALGERCRFVRTAAELVSEARGAALVVADLSRPGAIEAVISLEPGPRVVCFAPHVDDDVLAVAAGAGHEALARSAFFRRLGELASTLDEPS